ncbi:MAG: DUF421 domain-containing protein [Lachnospiraceae bacterium]|nr:DUF421 domain-containing protein [Lachnospiraceae bacterium]
MREVLLIIGTSAASVVALFFLTKLLGYRQISQMTLFDYIIGITLGSIAAEMATDLETFVQPLTAMVVYALTAWMIAVGTNKSLKARRFLVGKSLILFDKGVLYNENLRLAKIDIQEFLIQCRNSGYFDLNNIQTAVLEPNGKISILPKVESRPATPQDMKLTPQQEMLTANVIVDGQVMAENLKHCGKDEAWLQKQLSAKGITSAKDIFLATCDSQGKCTVYVRMADRCQIDIFE